MLKTYDCGCVINTKDINLNQINNNCPKVWELISSGLCKGLFQLETALGSAWAAKIKPLSISDISDLIALIRPGPLKGLIDDKSMTNHYLDRRNGIEKIEFLDDCLIPILGPTQGMIIYQESLMEMARLLAGFTETEVDNLRRGVGKKDAKLLFSLQESFENGCEKENIISKDKSHALFETIKASARYSFNKCLHPDTLITVKISTGTEIKKISEIKIGDYVLAPHKSLTKNEFVKVINLHKTSYKTFWRAIFSDGFYIQCSAEHKFLTPNLFKPLILLLANNDNPLYQTYNYKNELVKLITINNIPEQCESYDLEVDSDLHAFYANGYAVSNSHSVSYATLCYITAYIKCHFPLEFYTAWLRYADDKMDPDEETRELVADLRKLNIKLKLPDPDSLYDNFTLKNGEIIIGLGNLKNIGKNNCKQLLSLFDSFPKKLSHMTWLEFCYFISDKCNTRAIESILKLGIFSFNKTRESLIHELFIWNKLTQKEKDILIPQLNISLSEALKIIIKNCNNKRRKESLHDIQLLLNNPPYNLNDSPKNIIKYERDILGYSLTFHMTELSALYGNSTLQEFNNGKSNNLQILCEISRIREYNSKKGGKMAFLTVEDASDKSEAVVFPSTYQKFRNQLYEGNIIIINGVRSSYNNKSLIINSLSEL